MHKAMITMFTFYKFSTLKLNYLLIVDSFFT